MGWNYEQSANWLNDNGYTTPRGKRFGNAHTHSIVKKKNIREVRITKFYEPVPPYNHDTKCLSDGYNPSLKKN